MNSLRNLINKQRGILTKKQHEFEKKYNVNCTANYYIDEKGKIYCYNDEKIFFTGSYEVIGTVNEKLVIGDGHGLIQPYLIMVTNYAKNMIKFGEEKKLPIFINPRHKGKAEAFKLLVLSHYVNNDAVGYLVYKKPRTSLVVYLLIKKASKSRMKYKDFVEKILN